MRKLIEELFGRYYGDVYRYLYSLCHDTSTAEDLASEVFLEVVRSVASFRGEADVKTWIFSIARHRWYAHLRKQNRMPPQAEWSEFHAASDKSLEDVQYDKELVLRIRAILEMEPLRTQRIVRMRVEGYSFWEIGETLGISESSARVIAFRTKAKIRRILEREGLIDV